MNFGASPDAGQGIEKPDRMATLYDARGALFFN